MTASASGIPIDQWVKGLEALPSDDFTDQVNRYVRTNLVSRESLEPYAFFERDHYTRNLIFKNDLFEVMALCWEPGQISRMHNHRDQQCWMVMADGRLENVNYRISERDAEAGTCRVQPSTSLLITREQPMTVDEDEPVHQVTNCMHANQRALSVHIYSKPFDTCEIYTPQADGRWSYGDVQLSYWSEHGQRTPAPTT